MNMLTVAVLGRLCWDVPAWVHVPEYFCMLHVPAFCMYLHAACILLRFWFHACTIAVVWPSDESHLALAWLAASVNKASKFLPGQPHFRFGGVKYAIFTGQLLSRFAVDMQSAIRFLMREPGKVPAYMNQETKWMAPFSGGCFHCC